MDGDQAATSGDSPIHTGSGGRGGTAVDDRGTAREELEELAQRSVYRARQLDRADPVREWSPVGTVDAGAIADVDPAGLVAMRGSTWSLDWWIGAEDRWHHPSQEAAVRQQNLSDSPIVETAMRVPGGDVVHRAYGVRATSGTWGDSAVVVEVENLTAVPVALAVSFRSLGLDAPGSIVSAACDGTVVTIDGRVAAVLSRPALRAAHGRRGEPAADLAEGIDVELPLQVRSDPGELELAVVVPLPHTATLRVLLPLRPTETSRPRRLLARSATDPTAVAPGDPWHAPGAEEIAAGWAAHTDALARIDLPDAQMARVVTASQRTLLLAAADDFLGEDRGPFDTSSADRATAVCEALVRSGLHEPLGPLARALVASQRLNGTVQLGDRTDATAALLFAAAPLLSGPTAHTWEEILLGPVAKSVHRVGKRRAGQEPGPTPQLADALWRVADALERIDQPEVAIAARQAASQIDSRSAASDAGIGAQDVADDLPGTIYGRGERIRTQISADAVPTVYGAVLEEESPLLDSAAELARLGTPGSLPDAIDRDGIPTGHRGTDPASVAQRLNVMLDLAVVADAEGLEVLPAWSPTWWGQSAEAYGIRTRWGTVSFAVRWHGDRPAVLWEIDTSELCDATRERITAHPPVWRARRLDPHWTGSGLTGEALLSPVPMPDSLRAELDEAAAAAAPSEVVVQLGDGSGGTIEIPPPSEGQSFS